MSRRPWFVRRTIGLGWRPATWQGWLITAITAASVISLLLVVRIRKAPVGIVGIVAIVAVYAIVAATIARRMGDAKPATDAPAERPNADPPAPPGPTPTEVTSEAGTTTLMTPAVAPRRAPAASRNGEQPALVVQHLTKRFGERIACDDVTFTVGAGEVFGFLGPNGAGKTTTVRTLGTLIAPTSGSATVAGLALNDANGEAIRERIAIMPESPGLYPRLSVRENLEYFAGLFMITDRQARIAHALAAVNLTARSEDLCGSLSKGLRQRVALARALLNDPTILFLDEPTSGLDPVATREVHELIDDLRARGVTVFLTTHRLEEAQRLCDRVAILNTRLRMVGRPEELRAALFQSALLVTTTAAPDEAATILSSVEGVESWTQTGSGEYTLMVSDPKAVAPRVTRALVTAGADVSGVSEVQHSLEDVYLKLISDDVGATER